MMPPWMTSVIKQKLKEKTKIYKKYVKNKYDLDSKQLLNDKIIETTNLIARYYKKEGSNYLLGPKKYWSIVNSFLGEKKIAHHTTIVRQLRSCYCLTKAVIFNKYFVTQCTPVADEVLRVQLRNTNTFSSIILTQEKILNI